MILISEVAETFAMVHNSFGTYAILQNSLREVARFLHSSLRDKWWFSRRLVDLCNYFINRRSDESSRPSGAEAVVDPPPVAA
jgi:hypothetical protein